MYHVSFYLEKTETAFDIKGLSEHGTKLRAQRQTVIIKIHHTVN